MFYEDMDFKPSELFEASFYIRQVTGTVVYVGMYAKIIVNGKEKPAHSESLW